MFPLGVRSAQDQFIQGRFLSTKRQVSANINAGI